MLCKTTKLIKIVKELLRKKVWRLQVKSSMMKMVNSTGKVKIHQPQRTPVQIKAVPIRMAKV